MSWVKDTPERREEILKLLRAGHALGQAAAGAGITHQTLIQWRKADKDFAAEVETAERDGLRPIEAKVLQTALNAEDEALSFQASKFILERRKPTRDDYAPANPNLPAGGLHLNFLAQIAPNLMQLEAKPVIEGQLDTPQDAA